MAEQQELKHRIEQYQRCRCFCPRGQYCHTYDRRVSANEIRTCQLMTTEQRIEFSLLTDPELILKRNYDLLGYDDRWFTFYENIQYEEVDNVCHHSISYQQDKNNIIIPLLDQCQNHKLNTKDIEILVVGHRDDQFEGRVFPEYMKPINLNKLTNCKHSGNEWAESRVFLCDNMFSSKKIVGSVNISWDLKYDNDESIQDFTEWSYAGILRDNENVVICADTSCWCLWKREIFRFFVGDESLRMFEMFVDLVGIYPEKHVRVPYANQLICHKSIIDRFVDFIKENNIPDKIDSFCKNILNNYLIETEMTRSYQNYRMQAYMMELLSCLWFAKQDLLYVQTCKRKKNWYSHESIQERIKSNGSIHL